MSIKIEHKGAIAVVQVDNPPVNALSQAVRSGLIEAVQKLDADPNVKGVLLSCAGRTFIAGADVNEFGKPPQEPHLPDVVATIENATKPWLAAIHGSALGGGLEIAMACRFRVALASAQMGMPEVKLGLVPGAGGCVRLPRLVGAQKAAEMIIKGNPIKAPQAAELGLIDAVFDTGDLSAQALAWLEQALTQPLPLPVLARPVTTVSAEQWEQFERTLLPRDKRMQAPALALQCVKQACESDVPTAQAFERATFLELRGSAQARALRHVFFAERSATRPPELKGVPAADIAKAGVVGGGTMGTGIAIALLDAGIKVVLLERNQEALDSGLQRITANYESSVKRGRISAEMAEKRMASITGSIEDSALADMDLIIEAVFEDMQVKRELFERLAKVCRADTILATNTSYLDPSVIAKDIIPAPERFIGLHFFSPAHIMKLLEIVPIPETSEQTLATSFKLAAKLRKIPVRSGICDGFIGNRILRVLRAQAERLLLAGAAPAEVDAAMRAYGMPMGPFEAQDLGGLDIAAFQRKAARERGEDVFAPVAEKLCELGRLGQKTQGGWYDYAEGDRKPIPSPVVADIIQAVAAEHAQQQWAEQDIVDCLVLPMVNEAALILQEGIAQRSADVDLVKIYGYGFPRWRGGLLQDAVERGLDQVVTRLEHFSAQGLTPAPCEKLKDAAKAGTF